MSTENDIKNLNKLALICQDGETFYTEAGKQIDNVNIRTLFKKIAYIRHQLQLDINNSITKLGIKPTDKNGTLVGIFWHAYTDIKAKLSSDSEYAYIAELEELEGRTLTAFQEALEEAELSQTKDLLQIALLSLQQSHDEMKALQLVREAS